MNKAIIAGGRNFVPNKSHKEWIINLINTLNIDTILCGMAHGADEFGFTIAKEMHLKIEEYPANWTDFKAKHVLIKTTPSGYTYNALAGINRNEIMAQNANICILFPGGKGTMDMEQRAIIHKLKVYKYEISNI